MVQLYKDKGVHGGALDGLKRKVIDDKHRYCRQVLELLDGLKCTLNNLDNDNDEAYVLFLKLKADFHVAILEDSTSN